MCPNKSGVLKKNPQYPCLSYEATKWDKTSDETAKSTVSSHSRTLPPSPTTKQIQDKIQPSTDISMRVGKKTRSGLEMILHQIINLICQKIKKQ